MGNRFVLTGAQLGIMKGLVKTGNIEEVVVMLDGITSSQYIGETENAIEEDVKSLSKHDIFFPEDKFA